MKKIISLLIAITMVCMSLSGCGEETTEVEMPEIVFVAYNWSSSEKEHETGVFVGISGSFIDNKGHIKYFEFEEANEPYYNYEVKSITMETYSNVRNMNEFHKKIVANSVDTVKYADVPKENLLEYYRMLDKIDTDTELFCQGTLFPGITGLYCVYGVKTTENENVEYIPLMEIGRNYYQVKNDYAEKLYEKLCTETELCNALAGNESKYK